MLAESKEQRHERIALFAPLALVDAVGHATIVFPQIRGGVNTNGIASALVELGSDVFTVSRESSSFDWESRDRNLLGTVEQIPDFLAPEMVEQLVKLPTTVSENRIQERTVELFAADTPVPQVVEEQVGVSGVFTQERFQQEFWKKIEFPGGADDSYVHTGVKASNCFMPKKTLSEKGPDGGGWIVMNKYLQHLEQRDTVWQAKHVHIVQKCAQLFPVPPSVRPPLL